MRRSFRTHRFYIVFPGLYPGPICDAQLGQELTVKFTMPQSLSNILVHLIWSTRDRRPCLDVSIREKNSCVFGRYRTAVRL